MKDSGYRTAQQVGQQLGIGARQARRLIAAHPQRQRLGSLWVLPTSVVDSLRDRPKPGRRWPKPQRKPQRKAVTK